MSVIKEAGISPTLRDALELRDKALSGDITLVITPPTVAPVPTAAAWTRDVKLSYQTADGKVHTWFNDVTTSILSIANTSSAGTASIVSTTLTIVEGEATVVISGDAEAWLDSETDTLTVANTTVAGITVTGGTSVETFTT